MQTYTDFTMSEWKRPVTGEKEVAGEQQRFMTKVYGWMSFALIITGLIAMWTASTPSLVELVFGNRIVFIVLILVEFALVAGLVGLVRKISAKMATLIFILYSVLNGVTLSAIFLLFTEESLASTFYITAGTFGVMSIYGLMTKTDLTKFGNFLFMALIGLVIASLVNFFFNSEMLYWITT